MYPTPAQRDALLEQCRHARYIWNLAVEQWSMWTRDKGPSPGYVKQCRQLTEARAAFTWLRGGVQIVQQQALRDFDRAVKNFFRGTHQRPTWRKAEVHEGFRIVGPEASKVVKLNRKWAARDREVACAGRRPTQGLDGEDQYRPRQAFRRHSCRGPSDRPDDPAPQAQT